MWKTVLTSVYHKGQYFECTKILPELDFDESFRYGLSEWIGSQTNGCTCLQHLKVERINGHIEPFTNKMPGMFKIASGILVTQVCYYFVYTLSTAVKPTNNDLFVTFVYLNH